MAGPRPESELAHHPLVEAVARGLRGRCGLADGGRVVVAVSGGADSVALLRAMALLAGRRGWALNLAVGHVQHHLRGESAEADATFTEDLAATLDLPYLRADLDLGPDRATTSSNLEAEARRQRYAALATMARTFGAVAVATAHHADDQLETLLMRLLRGTGVGGLRGIAWRRRLPEAEAVVLVRPMLEATRAEVVDFLRAVGQPWREDHTNADVTRTRARLREQVLPVLRELRGDVAHKAVSLADHARQVHRLIEAEVERHHEHVVRHDAGEATLDRGEGRVMPPVVLTALLRRLATEAGAPSDGLGVRALRPVVRAVRDRAGGRREHTLAGGVRIVVTREEVTVQPAGAARRE